MAPWNVRFDLCIRSVTSYKGMPILSGPCIFAWAGKTSSDATAVQTPNSHIRLDDAFSIIQTLTLIRADPDRVSHFGYLAIRTISENP
jgi:hypothetical protein